MKMTSQDYNEITVVELQGELTDDFVDQLKTMVQNLIGQQKPGIVLDMSKVSFIDSKGLEQLLWVRDYCYENNSQLKLAGLDENCSRILEITRLKNDFDHHDELAEAVKSFA